MKVRLQDIPELPSGEHDYFLLARKSVDLPPSQGQKAGQKLYYREVGQGPAVLLLHGLWTTAYVFRNLIPLCQDHVRLIIPELLAEEDDPALSPTGLFPDRLADRFVRISRGLELDRPVLVGHAESGLAGLHLLLKNNSQFKALITIGSSCWLPAGFRLRGWWLNQPGNQKRWAQKAVAQPMKTALGLIDYMDPASVTRQELRLLSQNWTTLPAAQRMSRILATTLDAAYRRELLQSIDQLQAQHEKLSVPVKLIYGDQDRMTPGDQGAKLSRILVGSDLLVAEQSSGAVQVEQPEFVARVIQEACHQP